MARKKKPEADRHDADPSSWRGFFMQERFAFQRNPMGLKSKHVKWIIRNCERIEAAYDRWVHAEVGFTAKGQYKSRELLDKRYTIPEFYALIGHEPEPFDR